MSLSNFVVTSVAPVNEPESSQIANSKFGLASAAALTFIVAVLWWVFCGPYQSTMKPSMPRLTASATWALTTAGLASSPRPMLT